MAVEKWIALGAVLGASLCPALAGAAPRRTSEVAKAETVPTSNVDEQKPETKPENKSESKADVEATITSKPTKEETRTAREKGAESLAIAAPPAEPGTEDKLEVRPYLLVSGGAKADFVRNKPSEDKQNRVVTFALGRIGMRARWGRLLSAESEIMASGGIGLHGTSAYEGQAALQVRQQVVRLGLDSWRVEAGRFIDESSVDYFSAHVAETFLQDQATRDPLLFDGFNLGNGVRGAVDLTPSVRLALTFNAGNPVSTTSSLMIGGAFPPFERFYTQPYQAVNQGPNHFPDDTFHIMVLTPAVIVDTKMFDARIAVQAFDVNTNMNKEDDDHIRGYNARGTARLTLLDGVLVPFASAAYTRNDTMVANNLAKRSPDRYQAVNVGGGVDVNVSRRFTCPYDCADGFGAQYQQVQFQVGRGIVTTQRYVNVGATYWIAPFVSASARLAMWVQEVEYTAAVGETSAIGALRFIMP